MLSSAFNKIFGDKPKTAIALIVVGALLYGIFKEIGLPVLKNLVIQPEASKYSRQIDAWVKIKRLDILEDRYHNVIVDGLPDDTGCTFNDRAIIDPGSASSRTLISVVQTTIMVGTKVKMLIGECISSGSGSDSTAPKILRVSIQ